MSNIVIIYRAREEGRTFDKPGVLLSYCTAGLDRPGIDTISRAAVIRIRMSSNKTLLPRHHCREEAQLEFYPLRVSPSQRLLVEIPREAMTVTAHQGGYSIRHRG